MIKALLGKVLASRTVCDDHDLLSIALEEFVAPALFEAEDLAE
jgi:hypothetical protein